MGQNSSNSNSNSTSGGGSGSGVVQEQHHHQQQQQFPNSDKMHNSGNGPINSLGFEGASLLSSTGGGGSSAPSSSVGGGMVVATAAAYGMTPEQASREFDLLRREATKLERLLEDKVARYQQVCIICVRVFFHAVPFACLQLASFFCFIPTMSLTFCYYTFVCLSNLSQIYNNKYLNIFDMNPFFQYIIRNHQPFITKHHPSWHNDSPCRVVETPIPIPPLPNSNNNHNNEVRY